MAKDFFGSLLSRVQRHGRGLRWSVVPLLCLSLLGGGASLPKAEPVIRPSDAQVYEKFLQEFIPLAKDSKHRQYLTLQIVNAAAEQKIDPDLLFGLVAVESGFNSKARSSKGARGLGQVMPATARAVAPEIIHHPEDLYDVQRNLYVTALEVRRLLDKWAGDVRGALNEYTSGTVNRRVINQNPSQYVARICMYYALLKTKRNYYHLLAKGESPFQPA